MAANNSINFNVGFTVNKTGLNDLKSSLQQIQQQLSQVGKNNPMAKEFQEASQAAKQLEGILNSSWNSKLEQFNLDKLNSEINKTYGSVSNLKAQLEKGGDAGASAYNQMASAVLNTNLQLKQSNQFLNSMAETMKNTIKWGIASSMMNRLTGSVQQAIGFTKSLDESLNSIRIVTSKSAEEMAQFAVQANQAAKSLATGTTDYTKASLIYYQEGLSDEEVKARTETTIKTANVTGQSTEEVSEQLTAV